MTMPARNTAGHCPDPHRQMKATASPGRQEHQRQPPAQAGQAVADEARGEDQRERDQRS